MRRGSSRSRRSQSLEGTGFDAAGWRALTEAGVFSLRLPEDEGGVGLGMAEAALVFDELGRALVPGPLVGTHLAAGLSRARPSASSPRGSGPSCWRIPDAVEP